MNPQLEIRRQGALKAGNGKRRPPHIAYKPRSRSRLYLGYPRFDSAHPRQKPALSWEVGSS
jgi:hypothetical protein